MDINRFNVFGTQISRINLDKSYESLMNENVIGPGYLSFPSTGIVAKAYNDEVLRNILNNSLITFADGKITEFYTKLRGEKDIKNVSGFDLLGRLLDSEKSHFFYGLNDEQLKLLRIKIKADHPNSNVLGYKSPPFLSTKEIKDNTQIKNDIEEISQLKPNFIWIGISSPKQDYLMKNFVNKLDQGIMIGVGAVLLYKAGIVKKGPRWVKNIGMRWFVRLIQEPKSIWKKKDRLLGLGYFLYLIIKHDLFRVTLDKEL